MRLWRAGILTVAETSPRLAATARRAKVAFIVNRLSKKLL